MSTSTPNQAVVESQQAQVDMSGVPEVHDDMARPSAAASPPPQRDAKTSSLSHEEQADDQVSPPGGEVEPQPDHIQENIEELSELYFTQ